MSRRTEYTCDGCGKKSAEGFRFSRTDIHGRIVDACSHLCIERIRARDPERFEREPG